MVCLCLLFQYADHQLMHKYFNRKQTVCHKGALWIANVYTLKQCNNLWQRRLSTYLPH